MLTALVFLIVYATCAAALTAPTPARARRCRGLETDARYSARNVHQGNGGR